jgi:peroxiredoxin family protein
MGEDWQIRSTGTLEARLHGLEADVKELRAQLERQPREDKVSIICFSGEWDRLFAALSIASGALAMGMEAHLFFTFWAVSALRCDGKVNGNGQSFLQSMFGRMLPCGPGRAPLSRFNFGGLGKALMRRVMKEEGVEDIDVLFDEVKELGAHIHLCDTTSTLFGLECHELNGGENVDHCGVATFLSLALKAKVVLFI